MAGLNPTDIQALEDFLNPVKGPMTQHGPLAEQIRAILQGAQYRSQSRRVGSRGRAPQGRTSKHSKKRARARIKTNDLLTRASEKLDLLDQEWGRQNRQTVSLAASQGRGGSAGGFLAILSTVVSSFVGLGPKRNSAVISSALAEAGSSRALAEAGSSHALAGTENNPNLPQPKRRLKGGNRSAPPVRAKPNTGQASLAPEVRRRLRATPIFTLTGEKGSNAAELISKAGGVRYWFENYRDIKLDKNFVIRVISFGTLTEPLNAHLADAYFIDGARVAKPSGWAPVLRGKVAAPGDMAPEAVTGHVESVVGVRNKGDVNLYDADEVREQLESGKTVRDVFGDALGDTTKIFGSDSEKGLLETVRELFASESLTTHNPTAHKEPTTTWTPIDPITGAPIDPATVEPGTTTTWSPTTTHYSTTGEPIITTHAPVATTTGAPPVTTWHPTSSTTTGEATTWAPTTTTAPTAVPTAAPTGAPTASPSAAPTPAQTSATSTASRGTSAAATTPSGVTVIATTPTPGSTTFAFRTTTAGPPTVTVTTTGAPQANEATTTPETETSTTRPPASTTTITVTHADGSTTKATISKHLDQSEVATTVAEIQQTSTPAEATKAIARTTASIVHSTTESQTTPPAGKTTDAPGSKTPRPVTTTTAGPDGTVVTTSTTGGGNTTFTGTTREAQTTTFTMTTDGPHSSTTVRSIAEQLITTPASNQEPSTTQAPDVTQPYTEAPGKSITTTLNFSDDTKSTTATASITTTTTVQGGTTSVVTVKDADVRQTISIAIIGGVVAAIAVAVALACTRRKRERARVVRASSLQDALASIESSKGQHSTQPTSPGSAGSTSDTSEEGTESDPDPTC